MTDPVPRHPILAAIVAELTEERRRLLAAAARVPAPWREAAPAAGRWSGAQVLGHLAKVEASSGRLFSVHAKQLRESGPPPETATDARAVIDAFAVHPVQRRDRPVLAPELVHPDPGVTFDEALVALEASRGRLLEAIAKADGLPLGSVRATHPRLGPLTMYEWLLMIARHEARHVGQLDELALA
jgi:hypothetical protein